MPTRFQNKALYLQIPDSTPAGVLSRFNEALETFSLNQAGEQLRAVQAPKNLRDMARAIEWLIENGWVVVLDEFQYFNRKPLFAFNSFLQESVDRLQNSNTKNIGALVVLGSLHTEMAALLENKKAPLYARTTNTLYLDHLLPSSVSQILLDHDCLSSERLLFLWTLFEGVPKFYRDSFEQGVLASTREQILEAMFFTSAAPLRSEAENWFLSELRGQYDAVLNALAHKNMCNHGELLVACRNAYAEKTENQVASYVKTLAEKYRLVERVLPIFAKANSRNERYRITDLFLTAWLGAIRAQVAASQFRSTAELVKRSSELLYTYEGFALEQLVKKALHQRSKQGKGDIQITQALQGFWNKKELEIDFVCMDDENEIIRFLSCKRNPEKSIQDANSLENHVREFFNQSEGKAYRDWKREYILVAPEYSPELRKQKLPNASWRLLDFRDLGLL